MKEKNFVITDLHYGLEGVDVGHTLDMIVDSMNERGVDNLFVLGDVVQEIDDAPFEENLSRLEEVVNIIDQIDGSVHYLAGNHDANAVNRAAFESVTGTEMNSVVETDGGKRFLLLDTAYSDVIHIPNVGLVGTDGLEFLRNEAQNNEVVLTHYPITYTSSYGLSPLFRENPEGLFAIDKYHVEERIRNGDVDIGEIYCGHGHSQFSWMYPNTSVVGNRFGQDMSRRVRCEMLDSFTDLNSRRAVGGYYEI